MASLTVKNDLDYTDILVSDTGGHFQRVRVRKNGGDQTRNTNLPDTLIITPADGGRFHDDCIACWKEARKPAYPDTENKRIEITIGNDQRDPDNGNNVTVGTNQPC